VELVLDMNWVNRNVSPLESDRCKATMGMAGRVTPGLMAVIAELFHVVIWPS